MKTHANDTRERGLGRMKSMINASSARASAHSRRAHVLTIIAMPFASASATKARESVALKPFAGKSTPSVAFDANASWITAIDRAMPSMTNGKDETIALVGDFKTMDYVSVRVEVGEKEMMEDAAATSDGATAARALTKRERERAEKAAYDRVPNVPNGSTGTMAFELVGDARVRVGADGRRYYEYEYYAETCRATIEEGAGGTRTCVGPRGDVLDTVKRRSKVAVTFVGDSAVILRASAVASRFDEVREFMDAAAESFIVNA